MFLKGVFSSSINCCGSLYCFPITSFYHIVVIFAVLQWDFCHTLATL